MLPVALAPAKVGSLRFRKLELDRIPAPSGTVTGICRQYGHCGAFCLIMMGSDDLRCYRPKAIDVQVTEAVAQTGAQNEASRGPR